MRKEDPTTLSVDDKTRNAAQPQSPEQERDETRLAWCIEAAGDGDGEGAIDHASTHGWLYLFAHDPCTACGEKCGSQLEFIASNGFDAWAMCSGCAAKIEGWP